MSDNSPPQLNGVLVAYSYSIISGSKLDPVMTEQIEADNEAGKGAGRWSNVLFPPKACGRVNSFTNLRKHLGRMRKFTHENSYIFEDGLWRILPEKRIELYKDVVETEGRPKAKELLEVFLDDLPALKERAARPRPEGRGELYKESDYPSADLIRSKFKYDVTYRPIPTSAGLNPNLMRDAIDQLNALHVQRLAEANTALVTRFLQPFQLLSEQLKDPTKRKMGPVLDTIRELAASVPSLDLSGNQELLAIASQIEISYKDMTPEVIKRDEDLAKFVGATCESVVSALERFGQLGQRRFA